MSKKCYDCEKQNEKQNRALFFLLFVLAYLFFFNWLIYFNWRLVTILWFLPYTEMNQPWVYMCSPSWTPLPPPFPSHPSGSSQCTSPECPVSCIEPGLAICFTYDNIHVSMLFSPTLAISHRVQKSVLYTCVFCCPTCRVIITIFLNSIYIH